MAQARTPVISAIGHDVDQPLLDLVADWRASTPTDAGKRVVPDAAHERALVDSARDRVRRSVVRRVEAERSGLIYRQAGIYTGQILKGAGSAELPVQQPTKVEFVVNLKTAKSLGIELPTSVLLSATRGDRVTILFVAVHEFLVGNHVGFAAVRNMAGVEGETDMPRISLNRRE